MLDDAAHHLASGTGTSDRTLTRLARLQAPESAASETAFRVALLDAGWGRRRIDEALAMVRGRPLRARFDHLGDRVLGWIAHVHPIWVLLAFLVLGGKAVVLLTLWALANLIVGMRRAHHVLVERAREQKARRRTRRPPRLGRGS